MNRFTRNYLAFLIPYLILVEFIIYTSVNQIQIDPFIEINLFVLFFGGGFALFIATMFALFEDKFGRR